VKPVKSIGRLVLNDMEPRRIAFGVLNRAVCRALGRFRDGRAAIL
jgi:hypothetical protein